MDSPEATVEKARQLLNRRVEELQRNNGVNERSDLSIADAAEVIRALSNHSARRASDRAIMKAARWHQASLLTQYLDHTSEEFRRDLSRYGVYTIFELRKNKLVPLFIEAIPKYVGMSTILSQRLKQHAKGSFASNPADHVIQEFLLTSATPEERAAYSLADRSQQLELRRLAMAQRRLWVRTTHTTSKEAAFRLEEVMTHFYRSQGFRLWNIMPRARPILDKL